MDKRKLILTIVLISMIVNIVGLGVYYYLIKGYEVSIDNNIPRIINRKVIEQNIEQYTKLTDLQNDIIKAINKAGPSVVSIIITKDLKVYYEDPNNYWGGYVAQKKEQVGGGSGIIVSSDGYILTNKHVVQDTSADYSVLTKEGDTYKVEKIWLDPVLDLALIKIVDAGRNIPKNLTAAELNSIKNTVKIGSFAIAIGNALAQYQNSASFGIISGKDRKLDNLQNSNLYLGLYQTDAPINEGNSGGALLDILGNVIGLNTAISSMGQGIGFAIPLSQEFVQTTLDSVKTYGMIKRPLVGVQYVSLDKSIAKNLGTDKFEGVYIQEVITGSVAAQTGLLKGDIIMEINGTKINQDNNFLYLLYAYKPGDQIEMLIYRDKDYKKIQLTLGDR